MLRSCRFRGSKRQLRSSRWSPCPSLRGSAGSNRRVPWHEEVITDMVRGLQLAGRFAAETRRIRGTLAFTQLDYVATLWTRRKMEPTASMPWKCWRTAGTTCSATKANLRSRVRFGARRGYGWHLWERPAGQPAGRRHLLPGRSLPGPLATRAYLGHHSSHGRRIVQPHPHRQLRGILPAPWRRVGGIFLHRFASPAGKTLHRRPAGRPVQTTSVSKRGKDQR